MRVYSAFCVYPCLFCTCLFSVSNSVSNSRLTVSIRVYFACLFLYMICACLFLGPTKAIRNRVKMVLKSTHNGCIDLKFGKINDYYPKGAPRIGSH